MNAPLHTFLLTCIAMIAFAANSVLGRLALIEGEIGAGSFALIRIVSGALMLGLILAVRRTRPTGTWRGGAALLVYAGFFSYAYTALPAGTGAIILFGVVQITMLGVAIVSGERLRTQQWTGLSIAMLALVWLVSPSLQAPPLLASLAMIMAGIGWGAYSLPGKGASNPATDTAGNFLRASLIAAALSIPIFLIWPEPIPNYTGVTLAIISGAVTSGLGYVIWYMALRGLSTTRAGIAQLTVPALAALGGILILNEPITLRFALASALILSGVALAVLTPAAQARKASE